MLDKIGRGGKNRHCMQACGSEDVGVLVCDADGICISWGCGHGKAGGSLIILVA